MKRRSSCAQCGQPDTICGRISKRGLCADCGNDNMQANAIALATKQGPAYNLWLKRQVAGVNRYQQTVQAQIDQQARRLA